MPMGEERLSDPTLCNPSSLLLPLSSHCDATLGHYGLYRDSIIEASSGIRGTYYDLSKELNSTFVGSPPLPPLSISPLKPQTRPLFSFSDFHCASWPIPVLLSTSISSLIAPGSPQKGSRLSPPPYSIYPRGPKLHHFYIS